MTSAWSLCSSSLPVHNTGDNFQLTREKICKSQPCKVCGSPAYIIHYGAITCNSCKTFFYRYGVRPELLSRCQNNRKCEINAITRRCCIACRLAKCFAAGMSSKCIRQVHVSGEKYYSLPKYNKTQLALIPSFMPIVSIPTLDLLNGDRSNLNISQWRLLSNIVHAYDSFSSIPHVHHIIIQSSKIPIQHPLAILKSTKVMEIILASIQSFIRSIPDFQILTIAEQRSLLERNLQGVAGFNSGLVSRNSGVIDISQFVADRMSIYGFETMARAKYLDNRLDPDSTLAKLMLVILTFSPNCLILNVTENMRNDSLLLGTFRLLGSQNVFVELLWKYMIYRYGYYESVIRFDHLVKQALDIINHLSKIYMSNKPHQVLMKDAFDGDKPSFVTSVREQVPLWGNR